MPSLGLRRVGSSYVIDGFDPDGIEPSALYADLEERYHQAVAILGPMVEPELLALGPRAVSTSVQGLILDRKAMTWDALQSWIVEWIRARGGAEAAWEEEPTPQGPRLVLAYSL